MKYIILFLPAIFLIVSCSKWNQSGKSDSELKEYANKLAQDIIILDSHLDTPMLMLENKADYSVSSPGTNFDFPRAKKGGLKVPFWVAFISSSYNERNDARNFTDKIITDIEEFINGHKDKFQFTSSPADVYDNYSKGKILIALGIENGAAIEDNIKNIQHFYNRGVRYITLVHSNNNRICDASFDTKRRWNGLSPFGIDVVKEMNRIGMIIDVSHASDSAFYQVLRLSKAPVIATHSSCRYFTPGLERNMDDNMIKLLAENGGVIQINFGSGFLNQKVREKSDKTREIITKYAIDNKLEYGDPKLQEYIKNFYKENPPAYADIKDLIAHIDHAVKIAGIDHVGIGSDFDGLGDSLPTGLKDVSEYPNIIYELLKAGYSEEDIKKIMGGNFLRVWENILSKAEK